MKKKTGFLWMFMLALTLCLLIQGKPVQAATTLERGDRKTFYARQCEPSYGSGSASRTYVWSISNSDVLELVDKEADVCTVRAVGIGTATVSCKVSMRYTYYDHRLGTIRPGYEEGFGGSWTIEVTKPSSSSSGGSSSGSSSSGSSGSSSSSSTPSKPYKIVLNKTEVTLVAGKKTTLTATVYPTSVDGKVTWKSSNPKVATVNSKGKITAKKKGTAVITAKTYNGFYKECTVTVEPAVSKLKLNKSKLTLERGTSYNLKCTISPKGATTKLKWSSSNKKVATVNSSGKITAKGKGTATITVKSSNGKKATCKVTVKVTPTGVKLNQTSGYMYKGKTGQLKATVLPSGASAKVTWKSSKKSVVSVTSKGKLKALKTGTANITASIGGKKKAVCKITVYNKPKTIKLSAKALTLPYSKYQYEQLTYKLGPAPSYAKVTWSSSNPSAVSVDQNGEVRVLKPNTSAVITAKVSNKIKATCKITVPPLKPDYMDVDGESTYRIYTDEFHMEPKQTMQCSVRIEPAEATGTVIWKSSNPAVATVSSSGLVTCVGAGTTNISASLNGKTDSIKVVGLESQFVNPRVGDDYIVIDVDARVIRQDGQADRPLNVNRPVLLSGWYWERHVQVVNTTAPDVKLQIVLDGADIRRTYYNSAINLRDVQCGSVEFILKNESRIRDSNGSSIVNPVISLPVDGCAAVRFTGKGKLILEDSGFTVLMGGKYPVGNVTFESGTYDFHHTGGGFKTHPLVGATDNYTCRDIFVGANATITAASGSKVFGSQNGEESNIVIQGNVTHNGNTIK